ncbi:MAG: hypothetical protein CMI52_04225 [Parcubacteria group bacterium]|nr:hypothetical protein [Parcubacteria group bacterium]
MKIYTLEISCTGPIDPEMVMMLQFVANGLIDKDNRLSRDEVNGAPPQPPPKDKNILPNSPHIDFEEVDGKTILKLSSPHVLDLKKIGDFLFKDESINEENFKLLKAAFARNIVRLFNYTHEGKLTQTTYAKN